MNNSNQPRHLRSSLVLALCHMIAFIGLANLALAQDQQDADDHVFEILSRPLPPTDPLPNKKDREVMECGAIYNKVAKAPCPAIDWEKKRSPHCPVELYKMQQHRSCPGHEVKKYTEVRCSSLGTPDTPCKHPFKETSFSRSGPIGGNDACREGLITYKWTCELIKSCRKPEFGIELYQKCNSNKHPPVKWQACRHESFGVEKPKTCAIMMTNIEIVQYLAGIDMAMEPWAITLISSRGAYYDHSKDTKNLACLIKRHEANGKYKLLVEELKSLYERNAGKVYETPPDGSCSTGDDDEQNGKEVPTPEEIGCKRSEADDICGAVTNYYKAKKWFEDRIAYTPSLIEDLRARSKYDERFKHKEALQVAEKQLIDTYEGAK